MRQPPRVPVDQVVVSNVFKVLAVFWRCGSPRMGCSWSSGTGPSKRRTFWPFLGQVSRLAEVTSQQLHGSSCRSNRTGLFQGLRW